MKTHCPACGNAGVSPSGKSQTILVIADAPDKDSFSQGIPFATHTMYTTVGKVFRKELEKCGASLQDFRVTYLWLHEPTKDELCYQAGYKNVLDEAKGKKAILLVGADVVETFTKFKVSDVNGLQVDSHILSAPIIYALTSPALALHRGVGEVRFGIEKFVQRLEKEGLL